jgi:hypothetical protein
LEGFATNRSLSLISRWSWTGPSVSPQRHQIKKLELATLSGFRKSQHFFCGSGVPLDAAWREIPKRFFVTPSIYEHQPEVEADSGTGDVSVALFGTTAMQSLQSDQGTSRTCFRATASADFDRQGSGNTRSHYASRNSRFNSCDSRLRGRQKIHPFYIFVPNSVGFPGFQSRRLIKARPPTVRRCLKNGVA